MSASRSLFVIGAAWAALAQAAVAAEVPSVETFDLAPSGDWLACTIGPHGLHAAVLVKRSAQYAILLDAAEGPAFDELLPFDGRPFSVGRPLNTGLQIPVVFSDDGEHHAYLAKIGDDYVAFRDGSEIGRGKAGVKLTALSFSARASHLSYIESDAALGTRLVVDGKPEAWLQESPKVAFSADGTHYAYTARKKGAPKPSLFVDGEEASYFGEEPQFTFDGRTLITVARTAPNNHSVLRDGTPMFRARHVYRVYVSPFGEQILSVVGNDRGPGSHLKLSDQDVPDSDCSAISNVFFSPDGKRYAAFCSNHGYTRNLKQVNEGEFVLLDGKRGAVYEHIRQSVDASQDQSRQQWINGGYVRPDHPNFVPPAFTPDSSKFVYMPWTGQQEFVVVDEQASPPYPLGKLAAPVVGNDHIVFLFQEPLRKIVFDGQSRDLTYRPNSLSFSPDGMHWAYAHATLCLDGSDLPVNSDPGRYLFSPDSQHLVALGQTTGPTPTRGLFFDDTLVMTSVEGLVRPIFTPDSQHLLWIGNRGGRSDQDNLIVFVDGQAVFAFRELINARDNWQMSSDGVLTFVARTGDALKRFRVTPSSQTSLPAVAAIAKASGPRTVIADVPASAPSTDLFSNSSTGSPPPNASSSSAGGSSTTSNPTPTAAAKSAAGKKPVGTAATPAGNTSPLPGPLGKFLKKIQDANNQVQQTGSALDGTIKQVQDLGSAATGAKPDSQKK